MSSDLRPMPYSLAIGMIATLFGLAAAGVAGSYPVILIAAMLVGVGSAVFHPESSRVARMASGGRHGLAQSLFQVGGNTGSAHRAADSPRCWWPSMASAASPGTGGLALLGIVILFNVGTWYKHHGLARMRSARAA